MHATRSVLALSSMGRELPALALCLLLVAAGPAVPQDIIRTVNSTADSGVGTLRQAILDANASAADDTIVFALSGCTPVCVIQPSIALPPLTGGNTTIDGFSQAGAIEPSAEGPAVIRVALDGTDVENQNGLNIASGDNEVRGLAIYGFGGNGIAIGGPEATENSIWGNHIGVSAAGVGAESARPNGLNGVFIGLGAGFNKIGDDLITKRNVISGNGWGGVSVHGEGTVANQIRGNLIGLDALGETAVPNVLDGVLVYGGAENTALGVTSDIGQHNVIAGNGRDGIRIMGAETGTVHVNGNLVGTNVAGLAAVGNIGDGVHLLDGAAHLSLGMGPTASLGVISGNAGHGIHLEGGSAVVNRHIIGLDARGREALPNQDGVRVDDVPGVLVGGTTTDQGNLIAGNRGAGIVLTGTLTSEASVYRNTIGLNLSGTEALGNGEGGVRVLSGASDNSIGGPGDLGNVISGNSRSGVEIDGVGSDDNKIRGNRIGTDSDGSAVLGNADAGIYVRGDAANTAIGGLADGMGNWVCGNGVGISLQGAGAGTRVYYNRIGVGPDPSSSALGNSTAGLRIEDGTTDTFAQHNLIAHNGEEGVLFGGGTTLRNRLTSESIHDNGGPGIRLVSGAHGEIEPPTIDSYDPIDLVVAGTGCPGCIVEVYSDEADEGEQALAHDSVHSDGSWSVTLSEVPGHANLTAFVTDPALGTSAFSAPVPASASTATASRTCTASPTPPATSSPTTEPTATPTVHETKTGVPTPSPTDRATVHPTSTVTPKPTQSSTPGATTTTSATPPDATTTAPTDGTPTDYVTATITPTPDASSEQAILYLPRVVRTSEEH